MGNVRRCFWLGQSRVANFFKLPRLFVIAIVLALTGCASIPTSGDPQAFNVVAPVEEQIDQTGDGPKEDSSPEELLNDFFRACAAGASDGYAVAKQYLLSEAADSWQPRETVMVYSPGNEPQIELGETGTDLKENITVRTTTNASLNSMGVLVAAGPVETKVEFELGRNADGQWRISKLEDGVFLSESSFSAGFQLNQVYFLSADQQSLVSDPRWFPRKRLASYLMQALLDGPSEQIKAAVSTAFDNSMRLPTQGVEIDGQTANVDLIGDFAGGDEARALISWQTEATLTQVNGIQDVQITINSVKLASMELPHGIVPSLDTAVGIQDGAIVLSNADSWAEIVPAEVVGENPANPAQGPTEDSVIAWVVNQNELRVRSRNSAVSIYEVTGASLPSVDRWDWVWTTSADSQGKIYLANTSGVRKELALPDGMQNHVKKVSVSPDGTRVVFFLDGVNESNVWIGLVIRNSVGDPQEISQMEPITNIGTDSIDLTWAGPNNLVLLSQLIETRQTLTVFPLGGIPDSSVITAKNPVERVTAGSLVSKIYLQSGDGQLYSRVGVTWRQLGDTVADVNFPG